MSATRENSYSIRLQGFKYSFLAVFICGILGVYVKLVQLSLTTGLLTIARFTGRLKSSDISMFERVSFFSGDIAINLILLPFVIALVGQLFSKNVRFYFVSIIALFLGISHYSGIQSLGTVGRFLSYDMIVDAIQWGVADTKIIWKYLSPSGIFKVAFIISVAVAIAWVGFTDRGTDRRSKTAHTFAVAVFVSAFSGAVIALLVSLLSGFFVKYQPLPQNRSALVTQVSSFLNADEFGIELKGRGVRELLQRSHQLTETPALDRRSEFFGKSAGKDVIVFVMETGPRRAMSFVRDGSQLPGMNGLLGQSFVSDNHYSTYPYTSDAIFSIITGLYPLGRRSMFGKTINPLEIGLFWSLSNHGYKNFLYTPDIDTFEDDSRMYHMLGINERFVAASTKNRSDSDELKRAETLVDSFPVRSVADRGILVSRLRKDLMILEQLKRDIIYRKKESKRFSALFLPQIGHAPWENISGGDDILNRGNAIMRLQDIWLKEIVDILKENKWLEDTVIIFTADHGIRTRAEDSSLPAGELSDYSFNIPLLIFAPGAITQKTILKNITSHIDIAPTVLSLLGLKEVDDLPLQGIPVWQSDNLSRTVFFLANEYLGADGFAQRSRFFMWQAMIGAAYASDSMAFGGHTWLARGSKEAAGVESRVSAINALQPRLLDAIVAPTVGTPKAAVIP